MFSLGQQFQSYIVIGITIGIVWFSHTELSSHLGDLNEIAIENAYATCHNVQDLLHLRGFTSKPAYVKNKRGKSKKKETAKG